MTTEDVKVYLVDPRDEKPCLRELSDIYKEHVELQKEAVKRVSVIEKEMDALRGSIDLVHLPIKTNIFGFYYLYGQINYRGAIIGETGETVVSPGF